MSWFFCIGKYIGAECKKNSSYQKRVLLGNRILLDGRKVYVKTWGLNPRVALWLYTVVIRPFILYAPPVWWPATHRTSIRKTLEQVQRFPCIDSIGA